MDNAIYFENLPLTLRVTELAMLLSIGRNAAYKLVKSGEIRSIRVGRCIRIPRDALADYLLKS